MRRSKSYKLIPTPEQLATRFFGEVLAAAAGVAVGNSSIRELSEYAADERHGDAHDTLFAFFRSLEPYRRLGDFPEIGNAAPAMAFQLHIEPQILHGHFRAWLRKHGLDPEQSAVRSQQAFSRS